MNSLGMLLTLQSRDSGPFTGTVLQDLQTLDPQERQSERKIHESREKAQYGAYDVAASSHEGRKTVRTTRTLRHKRILLLSLAHCYCCSSTLSRSSRLYLRFWLSPLWGLWEKLEGFANPLPSSNAQARA